MLFNNRFFKESDCVIQSVIPATERESPSKTVLSSCAESKDLGIK